MLSAIGFGAHAATAAVDVTVAVTRPASGGLRSTSTAAFDALKRLPGWLLATGGHGAWIVLWSIVGVVGTLGAPFFGDHAFLLMMLAPRALFVALAADSVDFSTFLLLGTARLAMTDASWFVLGRRFDRARTPRSRPNPATTLGRIRSIGLRWTDGLCRWLCNHGMRAAAVLFLRPNGKYLAVAGAYGVSARIAGWASISGTVLYLACIHLGLGMIT